ncbi:MAG: hypothetical protein MJ160_04960 [Treponema sp.]|nr:hypothetical protein [Treponema sp.]
MLKKIIALFKKEIMLAVSLLAAIISMFITPPGKELLQSIDWKTLATLFMLLTVLEGFKKQNIFLPLLRKTSKLTTMKGLTCFFVYSVFFTSMFVTNDVSLIIFVPLTIIMFRAGGKEKYIIPVLVFENIAAIRGSLLTPFGSPQNLFLFSKSGVSAKDFVLHMSPLWIVSAILLYIFILFLYRKDLHERIEISENDFNQQWEKSAAKKRFMYLALFVLIIITIVSRTPYWLYVTIFVAAILLIFDHNILKQTDYVLLLTFLCFFTFSSSICHNPKISEFLKNSVAGNEYWWSILLSQLISNVPASIVLWPFTDNLTALLYGLDSAGLCSIIGSLASVINLRIYSKEYPGKSLEFMKQFEIISLIFFAIIVIPQLFLSVWTF